MKLYTKISLIAAAALGCIGIAFAIAGLISGASLEALKGKNIEKFVTTREVVDEETGKRSFESSYENITSLKLELDVIGMRIKEGSDDKFKVYGENLGSGFSCEEKGGTLHIRQRSHNNWDWDKTSEVVLEVPAGTLFEKCDIEVGIGSLEAQNLHMKELKLECGVGKTVINGSITEDAKVECGVGEVDLELENKEEDFDYTIECGIGEVRIGDSNYSGLGNKKKVENGSAHDMDIDCGIGSVNVAFY